MTPRTIAMLTDFGHRDPFVGICHGVIKQIDPDIPIIDIVHGIPRHDVRAGAIALADAAPYMPKGTIFMAVVDPGVGSERRAIAVETGDGAVFIGPDNGLLAAAVDVRGGAEAVFDISNSPWRLEPVSSTFHGRDIFSPTAARVASGSPLVESGPVVGRDSLVELSQFVTEWSGDAFATTVVDIDEFGNVRLAGRFADIGKVFRGDRVEVAAGEVTLHGRAAASYAEGSENSILLVEDSSGSLSVAINQGDASSALGVSAGDRVKIRRP